VVGVAPSLEGLVNCCLSFASLLSLCHTLALSLSSPACPILGACMTVVD